MKMKTPTKGKVVSTSAPPFAQGGKTKMFGKQAAGPQVPGQAASLETSSGGKAAKGGKTHMFGPQSASPAVPGQTAAPNGKISKVPPKMTIPTGKKK